MKPIYVVINSSEKAKFEKEFQIPYGYAYSLIFNDFDEALKYVNSIPKLSIFKREHCVIEKHYSGFSEVVWMPENV